MKFLIDILLNSGSIKKINIELTSTMMTENMVKRMIIIVQLNLLWYSFNVFSYYVGIINMQQIQK